MQGFNPGAMRKLMKQMKSEEIDAEQVIIKKKDNSKIIIDKPQVVKMEVMGQKNYQISGDERIESGGAQKEEDIKLVQEKTKCSKKEAIDALDETDGDIAEAILKITEQ